MVPNVYVPYMEFWRSSAWCLHLRWLSVSANCGIILKATFVRRGVTVRHICTRDHWRRPHLRPRRHFVGGLGGHFYRWGEWTSTLWGGHWCEYFGHMTPTQYSSQSAIPTNAISNGSHRNKDNLLPYWMASCCKIWRYLITANCKLHKWDGLERAVGSKIQIQPHATWQVWKILRPNFT